MAKAAPVTRNTVDLSGHPDLVVVYLGMQAKSLKAHVPKTGCQQPRQRFVDVRLQEIAKRNWQAAGVLVKFFQAKKESAT